MKQKELKIQCPKGYEIDQEKSTFECIVFKPIKKELPKTWEEFCETHPRKIGECYLTGCSVIETFGPYDDLNRKLEMDKNILPSRELAEAMLALCQLIQLRDCYNDGWTPDWTNTDVKYTIAYFQDRIDLDLSHYGPCILAFKSQELCGEFYNNFKDLIEIAKPLL